MTYLQKYQQLTNWRKKVYIMSMFHHAMRLRKRKHGVRDTAHYFNCSIGLVSENIKLCKYYKQLNMHKTREEALRYYK